MAKDKEKVYSVTGTTKALADGVARTFTVVGVVTESTKVKKNKAVKYNALSNGFEQVKTTTFDEVYTQRLAIGIATLSPADKDLASAETGLKIAKGKATKKGKEHLVLTSSRAYFNKTVVESILEREADIFAKNADKTIIISVPKTAK